MEHWSNLPSEARTQLVLVSQTVLDLISDASLGSVGVETLETSPASTQERLSRLGRYLRTTWVLVKNPTRTLDYLKQLLVALPQFARTVQRLNDRDMKVAQFQRKLAESGEWDRAAQIQRNQAAIALIQARIQKDQEMTEEEENQASAEFEEFKQIVDASRPPGNKLYTHE